MARSNTITPIPPTQCVKLLQISDVWLRLSTSSSILAPVVVNPDTVSNKASTIFGISPVSTKGIAPTTLSTIHESATITKPSLAKKTFSNFFLLEIRYPIIADTAPTTKYAMPSCSPYISDVTAGIKKQADSSIITFPTIYNIIE